MTKTFLLFIRQKKTDSQKRNKTVLVSEVDTITLNAAIPMPNQLLDPAPVELLFLRVKALVQFCFHFILTPGASVAKMALQRHKNGEKGLLSRKDGIGPSSQGLKSLPSWLMLS